MKRTTKNIVDNGTIQKSLLNKLQIKIKVDFNMKMS